MLILQRKLGAGTGWAGPLTQNKVLASDGAAGDQFGGSASLSSDGNTAIVGADRESNLGAVYVSTRSGGVWTEQQKLTASDGLTNDFFGVSSSLSLDGTTAIISATGHDANGSSSGAAYVFTQSGGVWTEQQKLLASDGAGGDFFGFSISISSDGNTAAVGAHEADPLGSASGAAYIFTRSGSVWTQQQKLTASDGEASDRFGNSISISSDGNTVIVGAYNEDTVDTNAGAAYIFTRSGSVWTEQQKVQASDAQVADQFGSSVSLSSDGNTAIIGALGDDNAGGGDAGAAYVFTRSGGVWTEQQKLLASDAQAADQFGFSAFLSSDGTTAIIGARNEDGNGSNAGAAYIFTQSGGVWTEQRKLLASDGAADDWFGGAVSLSSDGTTAIVGAYLEDTNGASAGAAYTFSI